MDSIGAFAAGFGIGTVLMPLGFWFWLIIVLDSLWLSWLVSDGDRYYGGPATGGATFLVLITALFLQVFTHIKILSYIIVNPLLALSIFVVYILCGSGWSFIKWTTFLFDWKDTNRSLLESYDKKLAELQAKKDESTDYSIKALKGNLLCNVPTARQNKSRITAWIAYWPWSLIWTFITDYVRRFFQHVFQLLESAYDRVQRNILKDFYKD